MKKTLAIGMITVASLALMGCQQQPVQTQTQSTSQTETSKASIQITEGDTATSKASLQIMPNTQEGTVKNNRMMEGSMEVEKEKMMNGKTMEDDKMMMDKKVQ
jgi:uncharacterized protein YcfL